MYKSYSDNRLSGTQALILTLILVIALVGRLWWVTEMSSGKLTHDEIGYSQMTKQFLEKGFLGYYAQEPNAFVTPGYPLFLAAVFKGVQMVAGENADPLTAVRIIQTLISVANIMLVFAIGKKTGRVSVGLLAAFLLAIYPPTFSANCRILTEVLYTFLFTAYVYGVMVLFEERRGLYHGLTGVLLALLLLVRPAAAPLIIVPYLLDFWRNRDWRFASGLIITGLCFSIVMAPWWIRNHQIMGKVVIFATQSGNPFLRGTDPYDPFDKIGPSIIENVPEEQQMKVGLERVKRGFQTEPGLWLKWFTIGKFTYLWGQPWGLAKGWLQAIHLVVITILGWIGVIRGLFSHRLRWLALIPIVMTALQLMFIPISRYMYPLTPIMITLGAVVLNDLWPGRGKSLDDQNWKVQYLIR